MVDCWKDMLRQCQTIKKYAANHNVDGENVIIKTLVAIQSGVRDPYIIWELVFPESVGPISDEFYQILASWVVNLPGGSFFIGEVYEKIALGRKAQGLYYTPQAVIDFILEQTLRNLDVVLLPRAKILDPACGCGYFLLRAYDILWHKYIDGRTRLTCLYPEIDWSDVGIHRHIIRYNLWGADVDPQAAEIATISLLLKKPNANENLVVNVVCCDSLKGAQKTSSVAVRKFWSQSFQYVIGNPPYLSFGLRGGQVLEPGYREFLRNTYKESAEYKLSYYALFLQRGIDLLEDGGRLGFILPDSFLLGRYYSKIRRYILDNAAIETLAHVKATVFKNASLGFSALCILRKQCTEAARKTQSVSIYKIDMLEQLNQVAASCNYEQSYFEGIPHNRFRLYYDKTEKVIIDKIDQCSRPLGQFVTGHTGIRSKTHQWEIVSATAKGATWHRGLISGSQLYRYGVTYQGHWLNIEPALLYKGGWCPTIVRQRKILIRQTGYNLFAAIDEDGYYHLNNIHSFVLRDQSISLEYVLMLINSRLFSFYYHVVSLEYGRVMAQTDIESLELLPFRWNQRADLIAKKLAQLRSIYMRQGKEGDCTAAKRGNMLDEYFNRLIYGIYDLTDAEINYIEYYEKSLVHADRVRCKKE